MYDAKRLYALQRIDFKIDELTREKKNQPEKEEAIDVQEKIEKLKVLKNNHDSIFSEAGRDQSRTESNLAMTEDKLKKNETRLYDGKVTNPKELKSLQEEVGHLKEKTDDLESELLEALDKTEKLEAENSKLGSGLLSFEEKKGQLDEAITTLDSDRDELIENLSVERQTVFDDIDSDVIKLYERLRKEKNGIAVAVLKEGTCQGCHITLAAIELNAYKDDGEIWRCGHCSRIVVKEKA